MRQKICTQKTIRSQWKNQKWHKQIERYIMFVDQKNQYCENDYTTQGYLQIQCSVQFSSVAQSCPTLCDPMNCSTPGLPVHHQLPEFTQTHIHQVGDAIQPSHPLSSPSPPAPNPSQHQSLPMSQLFAWNGQSIGVSALASFLPKNTQDWSPSEWTSWISLQIQCNPYQITKGIFHRIKTNRHKKHMTSKSEQAVLNTE